MIRIKHLDKGTTIALQRYLDNWSSNLNIVYDELADLYDIDIGDAVPIFIKYWSGVNDDNVYLHIGSKILSLEGGAVEIC